MYIIRWFASSIGYFSTSTVNASYRSDSWAIEQIKLEIDRCKLWWGNRDDIYYTVHYDGINVTDWYTQQVKELSHVTT